MIDKVAAPTRDRLLNSTVRLLKKQGPSATGTAEILATAGAPRGSFYFHFPDGKDQLVQEAVKAAGDETGALIGEVFSQIAPLQDRLVRYFEVIADDLESSGYEFGCAVGATTLDIAATNPVTRGIADGAFAGWTATVSTAAIEAGLDAGRAGDLASAFVGSIEGATMLARAAHSREPLDAAGRIFRVVAVALLGQK